MVRIKFWENGYAMQRVGKHITWSCARLSLSILLQDKQVDLATVALILDQTTTKYVHKTYKRHRLREHSDVIALLPDPIRGENG